VWDAHAGLATVARHQGQTSLAARHFEAALGTIERTRSGLLKTDYKISYLTALITFYQSYVDTLLQQGQVDRALEIADSSRGRVLAERQGGSAPARTSASQFRALARQSGKTLLSYWLTPTKSYVWVVTAASIKAVELPPAKDIAALVQSHRASIANALADPLMATSSAGHTLYRTLVAPAIPAGGSGTPIVIIPDGALHSINFETLVVDAARPHYWIEDVEIQIAPSLGSLAGREAPGKRADSVLLIGDPHERLPDFPALAYAAKEMSNIARHFGAGRVTVLDKARASPQAYRTSQPERFGFVHFTAHATANVDSPLDSAVILSGVDAGFKLYARDVATVPLQAHVVTVSACRSAGERAYSGEGLVGFAWAFLKAGAENVIAGLWDVDDRSTADLMDRLYANFVAGDAPATALRRAKLALLAGGGTLGRPYHWGPFQLFTVSL
jgi:CHAT domain-containing protein